MNTLTSRRFHGNRTPRMDSWAIKTRNVILALLIEILLTAWPSLAKADLPLRIEWLDTWAVSPATDTNGALSTADTAVEMDASGGIPTAKAKAIAEGIDSSAMAEVRLSRQFRVVLDDAQAIPVRMQGDVEGQITLQNYHQAILGIQINSHDGEVRFRTGVGIDGEVQIDGHSGVIQVDTGYLWHSKNSVIDKNFDESFSTMPFDLPANQTRTLSGFTYALGNSNEALGGKDFRASGKLSLPDPIVITDPTADYYYDVEWQTPWSWTSDGDASGIGTLGLATDALGYLVNSLTGGSWGTILDAGLDVYFEAGGGVEKIEGSVNGEDGEFYVYARGRYTGHAWINTEFERNFALVPDDNAKAKLRFDGLLTGDMFTSGAISEASTLAEISIDGAGMHWAMEQTISDGESATVDQNILAWGLAELNQIYTFEALLRTDSLASAGNTAYSDFFSSFEGELTPVAVPVPGAAVLGMIGIGMVGAYTRKRRQANVTEA